jgi:hypothetical protein
MLHRQWYPLGMSGKGRDVANSKRPRHTGRRTARRASMPQSSTGRGPVVFAALALIAMLLVAVWAIRGLWSTPQSEAPGAATTPPVESALPVVTAPPGSPSNLPLSPVETPDTGATPTPAPTPTPPPPIVVGAFGELPVPNIPQPAYPPNLLNLTYELAIDLARLPQDAPVYRLVPRQWDETTVRALARSLGIDGTVERTAGGGFLVRSSRGQLIVNELTIQYQAELPSPTPQPTNSPAATPETTPAETALPDDAELRRIARDWLQSHQLVSTPIDEGQVRERLPDRGLAIVTFGPAEPTPVLSAFPGATVTVASDGTVRQAFVAWPAALEPSTYSLRPAQALWQDVQSGRATVEVDERLFERASLPLRGVARLTSAELAWVDAGQGSSRYLTPVVRFRGTATIEGYPEPVEVVVTVVAVAAQASPRG